MSVQVKLFLCECYHNNESPSNLRREVSIIITDEGDEMILIPAIYDALLDFPASFVARCHRHGVFSRRLFEIITH
jgi:hypothetical protein